MLDLVLLAAGTVVIIVAVLLRHLEQWSLSPPLLGLLAGILLGPQVLGALVIPPEDAVGIMREASRLLIAVALMAIALRYPLAELRTRARELLILLLLVLPVMAMVTAAGAVLTLGLPLGLALLLGAALSPTDPVLASGIVTGEPAERDIPVRDRQVLGFESGINDGLVMTMVTLALGWALSRSMGAEAGRAAYEVVAGITVGAAAGHAAGKALQFAEDHREIGPAARSLYTLVLAFAVLGLGALVQADEMLSVLVAGLMHNRLVSASDREAEFETDETLNQFLVVPVFLLFGAVLPWAAWGELGWGAAGFVAVALVLRRLPAVLLLKRPLRADWGAAAWLGWFGPIGVAALFYLGHIHDEGVTNPTLWAAGTLVIAASTVVHSLTAAPGRALRRRGASHGAGTGGESE